MTITRARIGRGHWRKSADAEEDEALDRAARAMIANYGTAAAGEAERRARNLLPFGIGGQAAVWHQISKLIRKIEAAH